ncbi:helix-turn-helix domain-containing protein [Pluralibacter gergoviae]|uniref:phage repressor protein CI n=1 Tax=Pluralibacter gergoviae TaxID=61647 RepID=UPI0021F451F8|nr:phage repressor protein CI [Pluralibacter gergoviae]MCV7757019.1 helix-turn-helix domain-containing protein [Pluralibacter gergoviae]
MSNSKKNTKVISNHIYPSQGGGQEAISRILQAYGFSTRQALCDHLGVSQSTMANRWMRDTFPHDWLIACHLDTGVPMLWLATGEGANDSLVKKDHSLTLELKKLVNGLLGPSSLVGYDYQLLPKEYNAVFLVDFDSAVYLVDEFSGPVSDGVWLVEMDELISIRNIYRLPNNKVRIENGPASFDCDASTVKTLGKVIGQSTFMERK